MSCFVGLTESWFDTSAGNAYAVQTNLDTRDALVASVDARKVESYPGTGDIWYDISGNNNHFTLVNSPIYANNCFTFNGVNHACANYNLTTNNAYVGAIGLWARITQKDWLLYFQTNITSRWVASSLAGVQSPSYANGVAFSSVLSQIDIPTWQYFHFNFSPLIPTSMLTIMAQTPTANFSAGSVAKINVYNRALTAEEIMKNHNSVINRYIIQ